MKKRDGRAFEHPLPAVICDVAQRFNPSAVIVETMQGVLRQLTQQGSAAQTAVLQVQSQPPVGEECRGLPDARSLRF
ncbi:hypothetical protein [Tateyamaria sp. ANG-S1]|uniref:hypothetical protein n=1 Tax=Tateyamaria sp. ANG-S1 TaxID=1577905 RepID=UPI0005830C92|nr:hypothetical protein [Tateyamaria sp. ANG-S1]KIC51742.1 hypothetical protein RA29_00015 [Tateyamaria sp. ANG-S1]